nr:hypothetical protein Iba_chr12bCG9870 [Ipomoea batatas]
MKNELNNSCAWSESPVPVSRMCRVNPVNFTLRFKGEVNILSPDEVNKRTITIYSVKKAKRQDPGNSMSFLVHQLDHFHSHYQEGLDFHMQNQQHHHSQDYHRHNQD